MWMPCVPGGSCETSTSMRTPVGDAEKVAAPIFWPVALTMSVCADDFCGAGGRVPRGVVRAKADGSKVVQVDRATARIALWIFMCGPPSVGLASSCYRCVGPRKATANVWRGGPRGGSFGERSEGTRYSPQGRRGRRRPPFAKSPSAGRMTTLVASSEAQYDQGHVV